MKQTLFLTLIILNFQFSFGQKYYILTGTYTSNNTGSEGVYVHEFDAKDATVSEASICALSNPSYLAMTPNQQYVYAVNENLTAKDTGMVTALNFDAANGKLKLINQELSVGSGPCYVSVTRDGAYVFVANYGSGDFAVFPTFKEDGALDAASQFFSFKGNGPNQNQLTSHAHGCFLTPDESSLYVTDLGGDKIFKYKYAPTEETAITPDTSGTISLKAGFGPRHLVFSPVNRSLYVLNELEGQLSVFHLVKNKYTLFQTVPLTEQTAIDEDKGSAAIRIDNKGQYLYASTRGNANAIRIFRIDDKTGALQKIGDQEVEAGPRDFNFSPDYKYLFVTAQKANEVQIFKVAPNGLLEKQDIKISIPSPVSVLVTYKR